MTCLVLLFLVCIILFPWYLLWVHKMANERRKTNQFNSHFFLQRNKPFISNSTKQNEQTFIVMKLASFFCTITTWAEPKRQKLKSPTLLVQIITQPWKTINWKTTYLTKTWRTRNQNENSKAKKRAFHEATEFRNRRSSPPQWFSASSPPSLAAELSGPRRHFRSGPELSAASLGPWRDRRSASPAPEKCRSRGRGSLS